MKINLTAVGDIFEAIGVFFQAIAGNIGSTKSTQSANATPPSQGIAMNGRMVQSPEIKQSADADHSSDIAIKKDGD